MARPRRVPATSAPIIKSTAVDPSLPALGTADFRALCVELRNGMTTAQIGDPYADLLRRYIGLPIPGPGDRSDIAPFRDHRVVAHAAAAMSARSVLEPQWYVERGVPSADHDD